MIAALSGGPAYMGEDDRLDVFDALALFELALRACAKSGALGDEGAAAMLRQLFDAYTRGAGS